VTAPAPFHGFGEDVFDFYAGLQADNSKAYWNDHRPVYEKAVRGPMEALLLAIEPVVGHGRLFRPYRDVRFSKDKSPYKTNAAASTAGTDEKPGVYVSVGADGLFVGLGSYQMASDQVDRYRRAVDDDVAGPALERIVAGLRADGYQIAGDQLRTRPRGYPADHPRLDLLRHKSIYGWTQWEPAEWMHTPECTDRILQAWEVLVPLGLWLRTHVGASAQTRD
jgi:uncharacterized protein (TIGR02453 family)